MSMAHQSERSWGTVSRAEPPLSLLEAGERDLLLALAESHLRYGRADKALPLLRLLVCLAPGHTTTLRLLSQALLDSGEFAAAETSEREYRHVAPSPSRADLFRQAVILFRLGRLSEARPVLISALRTGFR